MPSDNPQPSFLYDPAGHFQLQRIHLLTGTFVPPPLPPKLSGSAQAATAGESEITPGIWFGTIHVLKFHQEFIRNSVSPPPDTTEVNITHAPAKLSSLLAIQRPAVPPPMRQVAGVTALLAWMVPSWLGKWKNLWMTERSVREALLRDLTRQGEEPDQCYHEMRYWLHFFLDERRSSRDSCQTLIGSGH